jgi:hypothetical protein
MKKIDPTFLNAYPGFEQIRITAKRITVTFFFTGSTFYKTNKESLIRSNARGFRSWQFDNNGSVDEDWILIKLRAEGFAGGETE